MKTNSIISLIFLSCFFIFLSNKDGALPENTGAPNEFTCGRAPCHNIPENIGSSTIQIDIDNGDSTYRPDVEHSVTVSISNTSSDKHGFQILALDSNNDNVGSWILTEPENMKIIAGFSFPNRMYVTHTEAGNQLTSWTMNWKAPPSDVGDITFYTSVIAANNNGTNMGDSLYNISKSIAFEEMVATEEVGTASNFKLFPNPTHDFLFIENTSFSNEAIVIYHIDGKVFHEKELKLGLNQIDVSSWKKGTYFVHYLKNKKEKVRKIIIN